MTALITPAGAFMCPYEAFDFCAFLTVADKTKAYSAFVPQEYIGFFKCNQYLPLYLGMMGCESVIWLTPKGYEVYATEDFRKDYIATLSKRTVMDNLVDSERINYDIGDRRCFLEDL